MVKSSQPVPANMPVRAHSGQVWWPLPADGPQHFGPFRVPKGNSVGLPSTWVWVGMLAGVSRGLTWSEGEHGCPCNAGVTRSWRVKVVMVNEAYSHRGGWGSEGCRNPHRVRTQIKWCDRWLSRYIWRHLWRWEKVDSATGFFESQLGNSEGFFLTQTFGIKSAGTVNDHLL